MGYLQEPPSPPPLSKAQRRHRKDGFRLLILEVGERAAADLLAEQTSFGHSLIIMRGFEAHGQSAAALKLRGLIAGVPGGLGEDVTRAVYSALFRSLYPQPSREPLRLPKEWNYEVFGGVRQPTRSS